MGKNLNPKTVSAAALLCAGMLVFSGFSKEATSAELLNSASENMAGIGSFTGNMAMELAMTGEITEGQKGTVTMELDIDMEVTQDPEAAHINGNIGMSVLGTNMSVDMENYTVAEGDDYVSYTLVNGLWSKEHTEGNSAGSEITAFKDLASDADAFEISQEPVQVNERDCYELRGKFGAENLLGLLDSAGDAADSIEDIMGDVEVGLSKVPVTVCIYADTLMPALLEIDFTEAMQWAIIASEDNTEDVSLDKFRFAITYDSFDDVDEIVVPEEAVKATASTETTEMSTEAAGTQPAAGTEKLPTIETEKAAPASDTGWQTYEVLFNNTKITLPCDFAELKALGYTLDEDTDPEYIVNKGEYEYGYLADKNGALISVDFLNTTDGPLPIPECKVASIGSDDWFLEGSKMSIVYPGGITLGSTKEEVLSAYGNPQDAYEGDSITSMYYYNSDSYRNGMDITIDNETGKVSGITIRKFE